MYKLEIEKVVIETVTYHNYAEYLLQVALISAQKEILSYDPEIEETYMTYCEIKDRITQLTNAIEAVKEANDLPF